MLQLPHSLPRELQLVVGAELANASFEQAFERIASSLKELFGAEEVLGFLSLGDESKHRAKGSFFLQGGSNQFSPSFSRSFCSQWSAKGVHKCVCKDLEARLASISYSAFSWPYPHIEFEETSTGSAYSAPKEFTFFIPFSSQLIVTDKREFPFFGYAALFFDRFPSLSDQIIQLVITLPELLSQLCASYSRSSFITKSSEFSSFAHDIKQNVLLVREYVELLRSSDSKKTKDALAGMERSLYRLQQQTNSVLLADKDEYGGLRVSPLDIDLNELIRDTAAEMKPLFESANLRLMVDLDASLPSYPIDPALFPSVIHNLLDNAVKYSNEGSDIFLTTRFNDGASLVMQVQNEGSAIPEVEREKIFEKRYRGMNAGSANGNGLGLYLVRRVVEAHGGEVSLENFSSGEKRFVVTLPLREGRTQDREKE